MHTHSDRILIVGCGHWGANLVRNFRDLGALAAVCDSAPEARARARAMAPGVPVFDDLERAQREVPCAGVVVATPAESHAAITRRALEAGCDVLCEKPLALSHDEGRELAELAARHRRILMVGHVLEYHPAVQTLTELVARGQLGALRYIYSNRLNLGKVRREENILWSFAPHDIAVILRLCGEMPERVAASGGAWLQPDITDVTVTQLVFPGGVAAHVFVSWLNPFKEQRLVVVGADKMASFDDVAKKLTLYDQGVDMQHGAPVVVKRAGTDIEYDPEEPLRRECQAFLEAMRTRVPPLTDAASALRVLRVLQAAEESLRDAGRPVFLADNTA